VTFASVLPAVVKVPVPIKANVPVYVFAIPEENVTLPETKIADDPEIVPAKPVQFIDFAPVLPAEMLTVPVERLVKNTSSADVGTDAPPVPPDVVAHLVPAVLSQFAVPPTQYLSGMITPLVQALERPQ
jgi:hypothetical protein